MKTKGSIQRKDGRFYFVVAEGKKRVWRSLKTKDKKEAEIRALELYGLNLIKDDREAYLTELVRKGKEAEAALEEMRGKAKRERIAWTTAWAAWLKADRKNSSVTSIRTYRGWFGKLRVFCQGRGVEIGAVDAEAAEGFIRDEAKRLVSAAREATFFARMFRVLGLSNAGAWKDAGGCGKRSGRCYRRLSGDEVRRVVEFFRGREQERYAELIVLGYYTGLRRGDVAGLKWEAVSEDCRWIRMKPGKTAGSSGRMVTVPVVREALEVLLQRRRELEDEGLRDGKPMPRGRVFGDVTRDGVNSTLRKGFKVAGIVTDSRGIGSFHSLRVGFISMMDEAGVSPHITDAITGHASGGMHGRYSRPGLEAILEAVLRGVEPMG